MVSQRQPQPRVLALRAWDDRENRRCLVRVVAPPDEAGTGLLKRHPNVWLHRPRMGRTRRISAAGMLGPMLGSHFSVDDWVHASSPIGDYHHELLGVDPRPEADDGLRAYVVEYRPRAQAAATWGRILAWIEVEHRTPLRMDYFDGAGERRRELRFGDVREVQSRRFPHRWTLTPLDGTGGESRVEVQEIRFDQTFDESIFTTRELLRP